MALRRAARPGLSLEQRIRLEWYTVTCLLSALTFLLSLFGPQLGLERLDHTFYDRFMRAAAHTPPADDIAIIAIDDDSIAQLGYWPWRRNVHGQLLQHLGEARAVGMDLVLSDLNPAFVQDDAQLAQAVMAHGRVALPVVVHPDAIWMPLAAFQRAAAGMGSINATLDSDGVVRSIQCAHETQDGRRSEHFVAALLRIGGEAERAQAMCEQADGKLGIAYVGPPGSYKVYPYAKVLSGEIPASTFAGKYVLVGAWASALGDFFNVPSSSGRLMAGVEILANALQGAREESWISTPGSWKMALIAMAPALLACLMLRRLSPRRAFYMSVLVLGGIFLADWLMLRYAHVWLTPTASLLGVIFAYPIWSWRSQEAALGHIDGELETLYGEKLLHGQSLATDRQWWSDASLPARITKLNKAVTTLRQAIAQREQALRFLSHDMRSPQNAILALTQLQRHGRTRPGGDLLDQIDGYAEKTLALVDGFVQLARAESMALSLREVDLVDLLTSECDARWPQARQQDMKVTFESEASIAYIEADPGVLARMFGNLLDNALKYGAGGTASEVLCRLSRDEGYWRVRIKDSGRGISEEQQKTLFEPFSRFGDDQPDNPPGSGLGLSFVMAVVKRHGGEISVQSALGRGSTFEVRLPALDAEREGDA